MKLPENTRRRARIEIIPLIDIMFFLLATFVIVSLSMTKNKGIPVSLPRAESGVAQDRGDEVVLSINEEGEVFWNKDPIANGQLPERFAKLAPDTPVFIRGDEHTHFHHIVALLDMTRKAGVTKVAIETDIARGEER
jgi:biopolymer transport protein ExbD